MVISPDLWKASLSANLRPNHGSASVRLRTGAGRAGNEASDMIHEILQSDVELARGMLDSSHTDAEILSYLASRGIEAAKAAQLVDDLRHGRAPIVQSPFGPDLSSSGARAKPRAAMPEAAAPAQPPRHHSHRRRHGGGGIPWWFVLLAVIFLLALGYALFETDTHVSTNADKHDIPPPPGK